MGYGRVYVAPPERRELERRLRSRSGRIEDARRARVILLLAAGHSYREICTELRCSHEYIARWKTRFQEDRLGGLDSRHVGRQAWVVTPKLEARVLNRTRQPPSDGSTHWSSRKLAKEFRISHVTVTQIWKRAGLKPHRIKRYMASNDPDFETKAADIIGLYLKPPKHAAIFSLDEKTAIQALDRLDPVLPLSPGRLERHGFEYYPARHSFSLRRTRYVEWRGLRQDGDTSHQRGVREVHGGAGRPSAPTSRNPRHPGQPFGPQDGEGAGLLGSSSESTSPFHADLLLVAEPSRELVFQDRARCHRSRRLLLNWRSTQETHAIHPSLQPQRKADSLGLFGPFQAHQGRFAFLAYRPLVACNRGFDTAATVDASRLAASLVGQILPVFSLLGSLPSGRLGGLAGIDLPVTGH